QSVVISDLLSKEQGEFSGVLHGDLISIVEVDVMAGTERNQTNVQKFILLGFPGTWYFQVALAVLFSVMYVLTILGNMSIIAVVRTHSRLHTPMYFFLCNLSFLEIWGTIACVPKAIGVMLGTSQTISFTVCLLQLFFLLSMVVCNLHCCFHCNGLNLVA
uniref:G-protein coupled receptors family 1 profile domain-containing protein n=1 Tax=Chelonoidis abingdonii TaxID=106734 RepID=A0A8C0G863_CHEAB